MEMPENHGMFSCMEPASRALSKRERVVAIGSLNYLAGNGFDYYRAEKGGAKGR